jgi:hypothetical protein
MAALETKEQLWNSPSSDNASDSVRPTWPEERGDVLLVQILPDVAFTVATGWIVAQPELGPAWTDMPASISRSRSVPDGV